MEYSQQQGEYVLKCTIKNVKQFKQCLDSVKFSQNQSQKYMDCLLQAHQNGIVLKSAA